MSSRRGPRVLIATLFLYVLMSECNQPNRNSDSDKPRRPETVSFDDTPIPSPSLTTSGDARRSLDPPAVHAEIGQDTVPFPTNSHHALGGQAKPSILSPIHSGRTTPQLGGGSATNTPPRSNSGSDAESIPAKAAKEPPSGPLGITALPTFQGLQREEVNLAVPNLRAGGRPKPPQRTMSIVEDLQAKRSGSLGASTPHLTPSDLELGSNPFESATLPTPAPAPVTPSLQSSIASKRPAVHRLTSEGAGPASNLTATLKERLERLHGATTNKDKSASILQTPGAGATPGGRLDAAGYFGKVSMSTAGPASPGLLTPRNRRRSSSASRTQSFSGGPPTLSRAFSRKGKNDHRRRSSSSADSVLAVSGLAGQAKDVPSFHFESNPHGNGGLQNAVRSVADVHVRTSSEPAATSFARDNSTSIRSNGIPGIKATIGQYLWIGTPGCGVEDFDDSLRQVMSKRYREEKQSVVVWVEDDVLEPAYDSFCKQNLWPTFHYQIHDAHKVSRCMLMANATYSRPSSQTKAYESPTWKDYVATNQAFANKIVENYQDGDLGKQYTL